MQRDNALPLAYLGIAMLLVLALLPTSLRPPQPPPPTSAEFSPDEPPDDESIVSEFNRGTSGTAGAGTGAIGAAAPALPMLPRQAERACPHGYGDPPRQTSSIYSAACAPRFIGDNGGATWRGVTRNEVRVAVGYPAGNIGTEGPVRDVPRGDESSQDRTWRVLQGWFNSRYQLYGRRLQLIVVNSSNDPAQQRAAAVKADREYAVFGAVMGRGPNQDELARRKILSFGERLDQYSRRFMLDRRPYVWSHGADMGRLVSLSAEYVCKKLWGRRAAFAGDPVYQQSVRKLGLLYTDSSWLGAVRQDVSDELRAQCGAHLAEASGFRSEFFYGVDDTEAMSTAVLRLRAAGVTTVVLALDFITLIAITRAADSAGYFPEWFVTGYGLNDSNGQARLLSQSQWAHAFGLSGAEIDFSDGNVTRQEGYRAYKEADPGNVPNTTVISNVFPQLEQMVNGIQLAGPTLTPETFETGMFRAQRRAMPVWAISGSYGPGDYSFADAVGEVWWDPAARSDVSNNPGAYRWVRDGKRYLPGEFETEEPLVFQQGTSTRRDQ